MATAQKITRQNYNDPLLVRSTQPRGSSPDGNFYPDPVNGSIQLITLEELALVDLGSGLEPNPLTNVDKIQALAIYFFLADLVEADSSLQNFKFALDTAPNKLSLQVGAMSFLSDIKLDPTGGTLTDERSKIADSGMTEFNVGGGGNTLIDRVYHGAKSLNDIDAGSQPFGQLAASLSEADRQAAVPFNFSKTGSLNEVIQTVGSTANGDATAGNFDSLGSVLILGVRDYGFSVGEVNSLATGVAELGAYSQGYGLGNSPVASVAAISEVDVFGGAQVAPFTGMGFTRNAVPVTETGFVESDGDFTDEITNTNGGSLIQLRAFMDKLMQQDTDQNDNTGATGSYIPKRAEPLYTIELGLLVGRNGLMIQGIPAIDEQGAILTADNGDKKTRPIVTSVIIFMSSAWFTDPQGWFRLMYSDGAAVADFNTLGAITATDSSLAGISGDNTDARLFAVTGGYELRFSYAYDTNTEAGLPSGVPKSMAFQVGGTSGSKSRTFFFTIGSTAVSADASTDAETN